MTKKAFDWDKDVTSDMVGHVKMYADTNLPENSSILYKSERAALCTFAGFIVRCWICKIAMQSIDLIENGEMQIHLADEKTPGVHAPELEHMIDANIEKCLPPPNHFDGLLNKWIDVCDDCLSQKEEDKDESES